MFSSSKEVEGAWVGQSVERLPWVMISQLVSSNPTLGSVLTARSLEPALDSVSPSLSAVSLSLSKINRKCKNKKSGAPRPLELLGLIPEKPPGQNFYE